MTIREKGGVGEASVQRLRVLKGDMLRILKRRGDVHQEMELLDVGDEEIRYKISH